MTIKKEIKLYMKQKEKKRHYSGGNDNTAIITL